MPRRSKSPSKKWAAKLASSDRFFSESLGLIRCLALAWLDTSFASLLAGSDLGPAFCWLPHGPPTAEQTLCPRPSSKAAERLWRLLGLPIHQQTDREAVKLRSKKRGKNWKAKLESKNK
jgi:hypothetical protein